MKKESARLDTALVARGLAASRERARALILAGRVRVAGVVVSKAGAPVTPDADITLIERDHPYVSRGGVKLAHALDVFAIGDALARRGWFHDRQGPPDSLHSTVSNTNAGVIDDYLAALRESVDEVRGTSADDRSTGYATLE